MSDQDLHCLLVRSPAYSVQDDPGLCFCLEFGVLVQISELEGVNPGSAGSKFGERTAYNRGLAGMEKGLFLPLNFKLSQVQSSEKGPG